VSGFRNFLHIPCALLFGLLLVTPGIAEAYCSPAIQTQMNNSARAAYDRAVARSMKNLGSPNDLDSMFCGAQVNSVYDQLASSLVQGAVSSLIDGLMKRIFQQACQAAIQPLQNIANQLCIPNMGQFYFDLNFFNNSGGNYCSGTPIFQVTPVIQTPSYGGGAQISYPELP
jgi:hypothetical protein